MVLASEICTSQPCQVLTAALLVSVVLTGMVVSLWQMNRAVNAEKVAKDEKEEKENKRKEAELNKIIAEQQRDRAEKEKNVALTVRDFLRNQLISKASVWEQTFVKKDNNLGDSARHDITVRKLLAMAAKEFSPQLIVRSFPINLKYRRRFSRQLLLPWMIRETFCLDWIS